MLCIYDRKAPRPCKLNNLVDLWNNLLRKRPAGKQQSVSQWLGNHEPKKTGHSTCTDHHAGIVSGAIAVLAILATQQCAAVVWLHPCVVAALHTPEELLPAHRFHRLENFPEQHGLVDARQYAVPRCCRRGGKLPPAQICTCDCTDYKTNLRTVLTVLQVLPALTCL